MYLVKTYLEIIYECQKGEDYSRRDQMKFLLKIQLNSQVEKCVPLPGKPRKNQSDRQENELLQMRDKKEEK